MPTWYVRLLFKRSPASGSPSEAEWEKLHATAGEFVGHTGQGTPTEFSSNVTVDAEESDEAMEKAVHEMVARLDSEDLGGWDVEADEAWLHPDEEEDGGDHSRRNSKRSRGKRRARARRIRRSRGYDPGPPPNKD